MFRLSEVQEKTLRESNEGREKIARQLSDLKSNSMLQAKKLEKRHQPRHEEKKELECGSTSESRFCSSSSNPGHVETQPKSRDHSKGRSQGNTHGKEKTSSEPKVNMPSRIRNADPSVSAHKDEEGKKSAKMLVDDHHAGVSGMRSASDNVSGSPEPVPDLELSADFDAGEKRPQQPQESSSPKTCSAITASEELGSSKTVLVPSPPPLENNVTESSRPRVHKNKSMQRLISSLWGPGTAKFQVT